MVAATAVVLLDPLAAAIVPPLEVASLAPVAAVGPLTPLTPLVALSACAEEPLRAELAVELPRLVVSVWLIEINCCRLFTLTN